MARFQMSIRMGIVSLLTFMIVLTGLTITTIAYMGSRTSIHLMADNIMLEISSHIVDKTINYLIPAEQFAELTQQLLITDLLPPKKETLYAYFRQVLSVNKQILMFYWADANGNFYMVKKMPDGSYSTKTVERDEQFVVTTWDHSNPHYSATFTNSKTPLDAGFDPRQRPWYTKASGSHTASWTDIYFFSSDQKPGITNSIAVYDHKGRLQGVIGVDLGLTELSFFLASIKIGESGKVFLLDQNYHLIARPINHEQELQQVYQRTVEDGREIVQTFPANRSSDLAIAQSYLAFSRMQKDSPIGLAQIGPQNFTFTHNGQKYLALYSQIPDEYGIPWFIGTVLPEEEIMRLVNKNNHIVLIISLILLIITVFLGFLLSRGIAQPLAELSRQMEKIKLFQLDLDPPITSPLREVNTMTISFHGMNTGLKSFQKYVTRDLVGKLINQGKEAVLGGEKKELTIFFSDIANFTTISEKLTPEDLVESLSLYFTEVSNEIIAARGTVDKYIGDAIMAFWGAPLAVDNHAVVACRAALAARRRIQEISQIFSKQGKPPFHTRIGINTGECIVGNIGSNERMDYTAIGDSVNLTSRLEGLNKLYETEILISESTCRLTGNHFETRQLDIVVVKGKTEGIGIYELIEEKGNIPSFMKDFLEKFNEAFQFYLNRDWQKAADVFQQACELSPHDKPSHILLERCRQYIADPPPPDWTGTIIIRSK